MTVVLEYIEKLDASQINTRVLTTVWMYIFWSGLVFKFMMLPFYFIFNRIAMHEKSKVGWDLQNTCSTKIMH